MKLRFRLVLTLVLVAATGASADITFAPLFRDGAVPIG
jgi:hypothetical protein